jgi:gas vesicle protein
MAENNGASRLTYFLIGFGLGAVVALLFAPKSGRELREDIAEKTRRGWEKAGEAYETARERAKEWVETGREKAAALAEEAKERVAETRERLSAAIEAGRQAYREEKRKAEAEG